jgi:hypothetical protein
MLPGDESYSPSDQDTPFHVCILHLDHIGPLRPDAKGNMFILVMGGTLSHCDNNGSRNSVVHFSTLRPPEVVHTDRGTVFYNEVVEELLRTTGVEQSLNTAYSKMAAAKLKTMT